MLDAALGWVGDLAQWVAQWVPRWVLLDVTEQGLKVVKGGKRVEVCLPGKVHFYWPATTLWFAHPVVRQTVLLKPQTITLKDNVTVVLGGLIVVKIKDIRALLCDTFEPDEAIKDISISAVHDVCCQHTWEELVTGQRSGELDKALKLEARKELDKYGVSVLKMTLTELAKCRVYKVIR